MVVCSADTGVSHGHPAWLVISPSRTGTSVHCAGDVVTRPAAPVTDTLRR